MSHLTSFHLAGDLVNHKRNKIPSNGKWNYFPLYGMYFL